MLTVRSHVSRARRSSTGCRISQRPDWPKTSRASKIAYWNSSDRGRQPLKQSGAILEIPAQWTRWCGNPARVSARGRSLWFGPLDWNVSRAINERGRFPLNGYDRHGCLDPRGVMALLFASLRLASSRSIAKLKTPLRTALAVVYPVRSMSSLQSIMRPALALATARQPKYR